MCNHLQMMLLHVCHKVNLYGFNTAQTLAELAEGAMDVRRPPPRPRPNPRNRG